MNRIANAIGHLQHVKTMIENDAVNAALRGLGKEIIQEYLGHYIVHAIEDRDIQAVEEFLVAPPIFMKNTIPLPACGRGIAVLCSPSVKELLYE